MEGGAPPRRDLRRRWGAALTLAAAPDVLSAFWTSIGSLYYGWVLSFIPLLALRFAVTLVAVRLWSGGASPRAWRTAWVMELVHSIVIVLLVVSIYANTFRHTGFAEAVAPLVQALVLAWPLAAAAASVWALLNAPRAA